MNPKQQEELNSQLIQSTESQQIIDLIEAGADIHTNNDWALLWATAKNQIQLAKYLLEHGANIHTKNDSPLRNAATIKSLELVKLLVANNASINVDNGACLTYATTNGQLDIIKFLIDSGICIHDKELLVFIAANYKYFDVLEYFLIDKKFDVTLTSISLEMTEWITKLKNSHLLNKKLDEQLAKDFFNHIQNNHKI